MSLAINIDATGAITFISDYIGGCAATCDNDVLVRVRNACIIHLYSIIISTIKDIVDERGNGAPIRESYLETFSCIIKYVHELVFYF